MAGMIDLFAGCGGMTEGFRNASPDLVPVAAVEWDLSAAATYAANFGDDHVHWCDIAEFVEVPRADVVIGGPPCQGFSNLGSKDPEDPRNSLWREYMRVVREADPQVFVLENVDRFSRSSEFRLLVSELTGGTLRRWSWHTSALLNAADYGVPQRRQRTILVASRIGPIELPAPTHSRDGGYGLRPWNDVRSAFGHLSTDVTGTILPDATFEVFGQSVPGVFKMPDIHFGRNPTPLSLARYNHVPPGGGRLNLPEQLLPRCWAEKKSGTTDVMGRMKWDEPSLTIRTEFFKPEKGRYLHPDWHPTAKKKRVNRPITHQEAALLQSFPESFLWCGSKIEIARQIGNAVPPVLAEAIGKAIASRLN